MSRIRLRTRIEAPIELVFDLARDIELHQRSVTHTGEHAVAGRTSGLIGIGETVTWRARHLGRWWRLTSRITDFDRPHRFVDEQVAGPFRSFRHEHRFDRDGESATVMIDDWRHLAPFGPLGRLADRLVLDRHLRRLLETRNATLKGEAESAVVDSIG